MTFHVPIEPTIEYRTYLAKLSPINTDPSQESFTFKEHLSLGPPNKRLIKLPLCFFRKV